MHQGQSSIKYAHNLPLELAAELGIAGALLAIALYVGVGRTIPRAMRRPGSFLVVPFAGLFLLANLLDWEWHLAGVGAIWAVSLGATVCAAADRQPGPG
jgi:O-antigen ligase